MQPEIHPELAARGSFEHLLLGRRPRRDDPRTLQLARYLDDAVALPAIPDEADYTAGVPSWPMYGNDRLGDCTCASVGHMIQAWSQAAGGMKTMDDADVEAMYIPGTGADDDGRDEIAVLNFWRKTGVGQPAYADRIAAYVAVDPANLDHVRAAIYLFGGLYAGVALPLTAQGQAVWDVVAGDPDRSKPYSWGGHAVPYLAYRADGSFDVVTWGAVLRLTGAFHGEYTDELYAVVSPDFIGSAGTTPAGVDLERLEADLAEVTR